ncbi:MAG TPA: thiol reductase thioredoxin, partial [Bacteroidales bacterium]|nr:thiol reductase thioredoxin [Bacteroidales bacterium]
PTLLFFKNGAEVDKIVGAASKASITSKLNSLL